MTPPGPWQPLPYRWHPLGTQTLYGGERPPVGALVALRHAVYRVVDVTEIPAVDATGRDVERGSYRVVLRPAAVTGDDPRARDHDRPVRAWRGTCWEVYPDGHYPVCAACAEPLPCREQMATRTAAAAVERMGRYELAGVCPACGEVVTGRQASLTWPDNVEVLGGPPVTYHTGRRRCREAAREYEQRWAAADPAARRLTLSCPGSVVVHGDGTYECTEYGQCTGPQAAHRASATVCSCAHDPACIAGWASDARLRGCYVLPWMTRRGAADQAAS